MAARDAFGIVIRTIGLLSIIFALNELRLIVVLTMLPAGHYRNDYTDPVISSIFYFLIGIGLFTACRPIVRIIYGEDSH